MDGSSQPTGLREPSTLLEEQEHSRSTFCHSVFSPTKDKDSLVREEKENVRGKFMVMQHISDKCLRNPAFSSFFHLLRSQEKVMNSSLTKDALRHCVPKSGALCLVWDETRKNGSEKMLYHNSRTSLSQELMIRKCPVKLCV